MKTLLTTITCACLCAGAFTGFAGLFSNDPIEMECSFEPHLLSKDQVVFKPSGKHADVHIFGHPNPIEYHLEVVYSSTSSTLQAYKKHVSKGDPLKFDLPSGSKGIIKLRLTAASWNWANNALVTRPKNGVTIREDAKWEDFMNAQKPLTGLKMDTIWTAQ